MKLPGFLVTLASSLGVGWVVVGVAAG